MLSVAEARALMLQAMAPLPAETVALDAAYGRVLAEPVHTARDQPPFAAAAMDGYALAAVAQARDYTIVGEAAAGRAFAHRLGPGEAVRISTGAPLPDGADSVLMQEDAKVEHNTLRGAISLPGRHVRPHGLDFTAGALLLECGRVLDPIAVALAASAGVAALSVYRQPRIVVMAGGDEIVAPGQPAAADQVYESGSFAVAGLTRQWGGLCVRGPALPDDKDAIVSAVRTALTQCDLLVLIGGASVGPHDHARPALHQLGFEIVVDKVSVKPGKPTWFGVAEGARVLGLPGNPASAIVCAILFLQPLLHRMLGRSAQLSMQTAALAAPLAANGARETYLRARLGEDGAAHVFDNQDSSLLSVMAAANALVLRAAHAPAAPAGASVSVLAL
jgi:molybdopterin molybdotransferase